IDMVLDKKWPRDLLLNVNYPNVKKDQVKGIKLTNLGRRVYHDKVIERESPMGWKYFWIGGDLPGFDEKKDSDFEAVNEGFVSVTPLQLDMTAYSLVETVKSWGFNE
ncbi:MAG: 5'/3'-nucleotidase SurE, partial [Spirochaetota bacterium]|nr:5'/3'-nucleotidase SurE [Spirochaetota bacterium]